MTGSIGEEMIGKTISHYKILEKLGEGGMGVVYKAQDTKLDRIVALKFLPRHLLCDEEAKTRFVHEAKAASALDHPNIATIHEIDETEGECFISMAYIEGKSLKELIRKKEIEGWDIGKIIDVGFQIAAGLSKAHQKGIVHRDIKSDNIMMTKDGLVKIMDFGLAKLKGVSKVTKAGTTLGTISYMSPEQARGEDVDHRTDIWSLGVVLYEMLTGELPFKGEYEQAVIYTILSQEPKPITDLRTDSPRELEPIVSKALSKSPDSRYQNAGNIVIDLRELRKKLESAKEQPPAKELQPSIAVLSFVDMSPEKDQEYFCDGMAEELINTLTKIKKLQVASRTSAFQFKEKAHDIHEIGKKLKVQTVLEGSVRKARDRLRITAQLVNVADGYHLWSEKYDRDMEDIFAIQDEISLAIVDKLKVKLLGEEKADLMKHHTENKEAYTNYLKGLYFWNRRSEVGFNRALEYFQKAIAIDPLYALPYVGIADTFNIMGHFCFLPPSEAFGKARAAAKKALEIDDTLSEAHTSMAWINTYNDWDWLSAENEYKRAIGLNPNYATAHEWFAIFLFGMGHFDEAITEGKKALDLDPLSVMINAIVGVTLYSSRRYDEAIEQFQKALEIDPNFPFAYIWQGMAYWEKSMNDEMLTSLKRAEALAKDMTYCLGVLGMAYALAEQKNEAMKILKKLDKLSEKKYVSPMYKAFIYIGLGKKDKAFEYFEKAYLEREPYLFYIKTTPMFDSLRSDPRFSELLKKIGLEK